MRETIDEFISYIANEKGYADNTIISYRRTLKRFSSFLKSHKIKSFNIVVTHHIVDYCNYLYSKSISARSVRKDIETLKTFFKFLHSEDIIKENILAYFDSPKFDLKIEMILTYDEIDLFLSQPDIETHIGRRDKAVLELLYGSGLRISEVLNLYVKNISFEEHFIIVCGKGRKERVVPINNSTHYAIKDYWCNDRTPYSLNKKDSLAINSTRKKDKSYDRFGAHRMIKKYALLAGITKNMHAHTLRHSFATHLLNGGAELAIVQMLLGHECIDSTQTYLHSALDEVIKKFIKYHPRYN